MPLRLVPIIRDYDLEPLRLFMGASSLLWGVWLLMPWVTTGNGFTFLRDLAPMWVWAMLMIGVGLSQVFAVCNENFLPRMFACTTAGAWWTWLTVTIAISNPHATILPVLFLYAITCFFAAWRD